MTDSTQKFDNKIQDLAKKFFDNKSESNFTQLYKEITKIVNSVAPTIVNYDKDRLSDIVNDISMTVWGGVNASGESIFSENKSFLSWVFISAKNKAIQHYKKRKTKREVMESDMSYDNESEGGGVFDSYTYGHGYFNEMDDEVDGEELFHNSPRQQIAFLETTLSDMYDGEDRKVLHESLIQQVSPTDIAEKYGINSRITVSSRATRVRKKLFVALEEEKYKSRMREDKTIDGSYQMEKNSEVSKCNRENGVLNGVWSTYYPNGAIKMEGVYENGKKVGEWICYYESGSIESIVNYSDATMPYEIYDRYGCKEAFGNLK